MRIDLDFLPVASRVRVTISSMKIVLACRGVNIAEITMVASTYVPYECLPAAEPRVTEFP